MIRSLIVVLAATALLGCTSTGQWMPTVEQAKTSIHITPQGGVDIAQGSLLRGQNEASAETHVTPEGEVRVRVVTRLNYVQDARSAWDTIKSFGLLLLGGAGGAAL